MHDARLMSRIEGIGDLDGDRERFFDREGAGLEPFGERRAFDEFEDEGAPVVDIFDAVDRADVGVIQRGKRSCLTIEALADQGRAPRRRAAS